MTSSPTDAATTRSEGGHEGLGIVLIGRNEGARLAACLDSLRGLAVPTVYVDSGSEDGSVALAKVSGAEVVELDRSRPFTAARARNAGFAELLRRAPELEAVQFLDGDCRLQPGWLACGLELLRRAPDVGAVCGRRRESAPERSMYNRLCDVEWISPPSGEAGKLGFGGDVMLRVEALRRVGGYRESLIAGEDPELSARLRRDGWRVLRLDAPMTQHDAAMTRFSQWWRRTLRSGHAYAEVADLHRGSGERLFVRELARSTLWGLGLPLLVLALALLDVRLALVAAAAYPIQIARVARDARRCAPDAATATAWGAACVLGALPQALGAARYLRGRLSGRRSALIEYHRPGAPGPG